MKTRIKRVLTQMVSVGVAALILLFLIEASASAFSGSGAGTLADPYQITNAAQLQEMKNNLTAHYVLMNDIDCSDTVNWNSGAGFEPVGDKANRFIGSLDGQNYVINGLFINRGNYVGLFGYSESVEISNVGLVDVDITGEFSTGGLVGYKYYGTITNSYATGNVSGGWCVGGLVGYSDHGTITNCYSTGSVTATGHDVGGLVGVNRGNITNSYATGDVSGSRWAGGLVGLTSGPITNSYATGNVSSGWCAGLVGQNYHATITNSYATGSVSGGPYVGGLVGWNYYGTMSNSYATGNVSGTDRVGGLVGCNYYGTMSNSYSTGNVSGDTNVGGLVGENLYATITNSYYNNHAGNPSVCVGHIVGGSTDCITIQDNESYFYYSSNPPMSSWDFVNVWGIDEGIIYPYLLWQIPPAIPAFIDIDPDTLNLKRKGRWITCYIWLPEDYNVADIDPYSIVLEDEIEAAWMWFDEKEQVAMAKFSRSEVQDILEPNEAVELTVSGELTDGTEFEGTDTIRVIGPIIPPFAIKRLKVKIGKSAGEDSISISGTIDALIRRIAGATSIDITIKAADDSIVYSESIPFSADSMKKGKLNYKNKVGKGEPGAITKFSLNLVKHTFSMGARNIDLSGLTYPLTLEIVIGTYSASAQAG